MISQKLIVDVIPAFQDNYIWLIRSPNQNKAWVVDPGDAAPVLQRLNDLQVRLDGVLLTHHHADHDGGIPALKKYFPDLRVISGVGSKSRYTTETISDNEATTLLEHTFVLIAVPGHTLDHVAFYNQTNNLLFCGDTIFGGGCGRLFEGSPDVMYASLQRLAKLPLETQLYCAHEYTEANLRFALALEAKNLNLQRRAKLTRELRKKSLPTVPSQLATELETNPFLRCSEPSIMAAASSHVGAHLENPAEVFSVIRTWKNDFK